MKALAAVLATVGVVILLILVGLAAGWIGGTAETVSFDHSKDQTTAVLGDWQAMRTAAENACEAQDSKSDPGDPLLIEKPGFAYRAQYRRISVDYNRRMGNFFEARNTRGLPIPGGISNLPYPAPSLREMQQEVC